MVRQQIPCSYLPTTLCIDKPGVVPRVRLLGHFKNCPHFLTGAILTWSCPTYSSISESNTLPRNSPSSSLIYCSCTPHFPIWGKFLVGGKDEETNLQYRSLFPNFWPQSLIISSPGMDRLLLCVYGTRSGDDTYSLTGTTLFFPGLEEFRLGCILSQH